MGSIATLSINEQCRVFITMPSFAVVIFDVVTVELNIFKHRVCILYSSKIQTF
jgi:hypothetical protein